MRKKIWATALAATLLLSASACGGSSNSETITKSDYTKAYESDWPWTSDTTSIECRDHYAITIEIDGTVYPLNGVAKDWEYSTNDLKEVWADDQDINGLKVDASDYTQMARDFCGFNR